VLQRLTAPGRHDDQVRIGPREAVDRANAEELLAADARRRGGDRGPQAGIEAQHALELELVEFAAGMREELTHRRAVDLSQQSQPHAIPAGERIAARKQSAGIDGASVHGNGAGKQRFLSAA
jgi:hypothetical protein